MIRKLSKLVLLVRAFFPSKLPVGMQEFDTWAESFFELYTMPTADKDSIKFVLATLIVHGGQQMAYKSKFYFYLTLQAAASKQIASAVFQDIKIRQKEAQEAEAKKKAEESKVVSIASAKE